MKALLPMIFALATVAVSTANAGALNGPKYDRTTVDAHHNDNFRPIVFRGGEQATITVVGDGDTDLDLYVYDEYGNEVGRDDDQTDDCIVTFTPRWTGPFRIVVKNRGRVYNEYTLRTN